MKQSISVAKDNITNEILAWGANLCSVTDSLIDRPAGIAYHVEDWVIQDFDDLPFDKWIAL